MLYYIPFFAVILIALQGCSRQLNNQVDHEMLRCGVSRQEVGNGQIFRAETSLSDGLFKVFDRDGQLVSDYKVTPKNCLLLPEKSSASSIVLSNGFAARFDEEVFRFKSCGQDCIAFPVCDGFTETSWDEGPWAYAQVKHFDDNLSAVLETESGPRALDVSKNSCVKFPASAVGMVRLTDSQGNFLETSIQDLMKASLKQDFLFQVSLRPPLSADEIFCKKNSESYKMSEASCVPKDLRDYCIDFRSEYGKRELEKIFRTADCTKIWVDMRSAEKISFTAMRLQSTKFFSNLPDLKGLNLSGNPDLASFKEMRGTPKIEELVVSHAGFDLSEISLFPNLKALTIAALKGNWKNSPSFPQIRKVEISQEHEFDPSVLEKFPEVEELTIVALYDLNENKTSLDVLASLKKLRKLTIVSSSESGVLIPSLENLEVLEADSLIRFGGRYPKLRVVNLEYSGYFEALKFSHELEELNIGNDPWVVGHESLKGIVLSKVKKVRIKEIQTLKTLSSFPNVEDVDISDFYMSDPGDNRGVATLQALPNLKRLSLGKIPNGILKLDGYYFPKLISLKIVCPCSYKNMSLPNLEVLSVGIGYHDESAADLPTINVPSIKQMDLDNRRLFYADLPFMPELTSLRIGYSDSLDTLKGKVPKLRNLNLCKSPDFSTAYVPENLDYLRVSCFVDFDFMAKLKTLKSLELKFPFQSINASTEAGLKVNSLHMDGTSEWGDSNLQFIDLDSIDELKISSRDVDSGLRLLPNVLSKVEKIELNPNPDLSAKVILVPSSDLSKISLISKKRFPNLMEFRASDINVDRHDADTLQQIRQLAVLTESVSTSMAFTGYFKDALCLEMSSDEALYDSFVGRLCRREQVETVIGNWEYRPQAGLGGWDYSF